MTYSGQQRRTNAIASMYGYKTAVHENTVALEDFNVGDGAIVLTKNGEPIMSGKIDEIDESSIKIGDRRYYATEYSFRRI